MVVALSAAACRRAPTEAPLDRAQLTVFRSLVETSTGSYLPELDVEAPPSFVYRGPLRKDLRISLEVGSAKIDLPIVLHEAREEIVVLRAGPPDRSVTAGRGKISLGDTAFEIVWSEPPSAIEVLREARALRKAGRYAEAERAYAATASVAEPKIKFVALGERAGVLGQTGENDRAAEVYLAAAEAAKIARRPSQVTRNWRAAAYSYYIRRRFDEVEPLLLRAEELDRKTGNASGLARAAHYRGLTLQWRGRFKKALEAFEDGFAIAAAHGLDDDAALLLKSQAPLLQDMGLHQRAIAVLDRASSYFRSAGDWQRALYLNDRGWVLARAMARRAIPVDWNVPQKFLEEALSLVRGLGDPAQEANFLGSLLWVAHTRGSTQTSEIITRIDSIPGADRSAAALFVLGVKGEVLLRAGDNLGAEKLFSDLMARADEEALEAPSEDRVRAFHGLAEVARRTGRIVRASDLYTRAIDELQRLARETDLLDARSGFLVDREPLLAAAIELELHRGRIDRAFHFAERARTIVLRGLEQPLSMDALTSEKQAEWMRRRAAYNVLRDAFERTRKDEELLLGPAARQSALRKARARAEMAVAFNAAYSYLEEASPNLTPAAAQLEDVSRALGDSEALWTQVRLGDRILTVTVTKRSSTHAWDLSPDFAPRELIGARHVYVVSGAERSPTEILAAKLDGASLLSRATVSFLPHTGLLLRAPSRPAKPALIVADPDGTLPEARLEGAKIVKQLAGARGLFGLDATRNAVLEAADGATLFHFSGHANIHVESPWDAYLALAGGERLSLEDLLIARPQVGRVVLSGCETGVSRALTHRESIGLPEAFLLSGAGTVLATSGPIADAASRRFIERFYAAGGADHPIAAFRAAALDAISSGDDSWRTFYILGREQ